MLDPGLNLPVEGREEEGEKGRGGRREGKGIGKERRRVRGVGGSCRRMLITLGYDFEVAAVNVNGTGPQLCRP